MKLERLRRIMAEKVERGDVPGLAALVSQGDDVWTEAFGTLRTDGGPKVERNTIFRIASITKPVVAAAAMQLVENCSIGLDDAIEQWIPELANRRVLRTLASALDDTVPARRQITVRDLLTYRMGLGSLMAAPGTYPIQEPIREYRIGGDRPYFPGEQGTTAEWIAKLGELPLAAQPGERWMYQVSGDVLGVLVGRVAGKTLGAYLREHIFEPLGMKDTGFSVPQEKRERFPDMYVYDREQKKLRLVESAAESVWREAPDFETGGGGLVSTVDDYFAFCRMMINHGRHGREQILSRASIELMTSDQVTAGERAGAEIFFGDFSSWGFGVAVDIARREIYQTPGRYGWTGGYGTTAYTDPEKGVIGILFSQRMMDSPEPPRVFTDFWNAAYAGLE